MNYWDKLQAAKEFLSEQIKIPRYAMVLGSGLGGVLDQASDHENEVRFDQIPHLAKSNVEGHKARLVVCRLGGVRVLGVQGRLHFYEGHPMEQVVFLARAIALAGVEMFLLTNASGGLNPQLAPLDLLMIQDQLNLMVNPLLGPNENRLGPRFPDMSEIYDHKLQRIMRRSAEMSGTTLKEGVYLGISGPTYETPAEVKMYRSWGADVVGMSTVPEAIALRHMGKKVMGLSCVTNLAAGLGETSHSDVLKGAAKIRAKVSALVNVLFPQIEKELHA